MSPNSPRSQGSPEPQEETPLLRDGNGPRTKTPLPITQIVVLLMLQLCEPITSLSINPYINQLVSELPVVGGDERKVGYYAGFIVSLYFAAEAVTVLQWSRLSDYVGRKPVLLCGILGIVVSSILFGLSRSFPALVFRTPRPFIGGVLSRPQDRWPNVFSHPFWGEYPYFLPCLTTAAYALLSFTLAAIFLKETVNSGPIMKPNTEVNSDVPRVGEGEILDGPVKDHECPLPLRAALLTRPVVVSIANYCMISLLEIIAITLIPLIWSTSVEFGGLGIFQFVAFPHIVERLGPRRIFIASTLCFIPVYIMFPFENLTLRHSFRGANMVTGLLTIPQLSAISLSDMGFITIFMYISSAAPNKRSLGATNGVAQTMVSIQRAVGPATAASLFAFSLDNNILGGNFAYVVLHAVVWVGLGVAVQLPRNTWKH
ncbi:major facilitator superfamily domain-containing protein [Lactarius sanguifluus]|nr:major facilitator superfamily domain-containing protein [Lactarius sanguifluus]